MYTKTGCHWAEDAKDFLTEQGVSFEERDIYTNQAWRDEVETATEQNKSPTLNIDGIWLPDAGIQDIAQALEIEL